MDFINKIIDKEKLPSVEDISFYPLDKSYLYVMRISTIITSFIIMAVFSVYNFFSRSFNLNEYIMILSGILIISILRFLFCTRLFNAKAYAIRDKDIIYKNGFIWKSLTTVPFNRIQHTEIKEGFISRLFSLQTVMFYTAGGSSSDLSIKGLSINDAQKIKEFVNSNLKEYAK